MSKPWRCYLMTEEKFNKKHPDKIGSSALCISSKKQIHFTKENFDLGCARHEIRHAFISALCLSSSDLTLDQFEEIICELDCEYWDEMDKASRYIEMSFL